MTGRVGSVIVTEMVGDIELPGRRDSRFLRLLGAGRVLGVIGGVLLALVLSWGASAQAEPPNYSAFAYEVVDGDTVRVRRGDRFEMVRLIGVDTPETHENERAKRQSKRTRRGIKAVLEMGRRAHAYTRSLVRRGDLLRIELGENPRDRYGRTLAYVYLTDGTMLNEQILRNGYGYLLTYEDNQRHLARLRGAAREARARSAGLFGEDAKE